MAENVSSVSANTLFLEAHIYGSKKSGEEFNFARGYHFWTPPSELAEGLSDSHLPK